MTAPSFTLDQSSKSVVSALERPQSSQFDCSMLQHIERILMQRMDTVDNMAYVKTVAPFIKSLFHPR